MPAPLEYLSDEWTDTDAEINSGNFSDICSNNGYDDDSIEGSDAGSEAGSDDGSDDDSDDGGLDREIFGPLLDIGEDSILALATRIAQDVLHIAPDNAELLDTLSGSYNIVHIVQVEDLKLVIRIPATGWGDGMTKDASDALASQVTTMRFIREKTRAPVPEVYNWDPTINNEISAPFICMSFVPGETVSSVWFNESIDTEAREQLRLNILTSLSVIMAKFSSLSFDKMGSIKQAEDGTISIGPLYEWDENEDGSLHAKAVRTYFSTDEYLACNMQTRTDDSVWDRAEAKMIEAILEHSSFLHSHSRFVLTPPDFDSQNILVDEEGNVTGLIGWDHCQTEPPQLGYAAYPGWITKDWDPLMYGWPYEQDFEDSPETLQRYREHYNKEMCKALSGHEDMSLTKDSHIAEAAFMGALNNMTRLDICRKFVEVALNLDQDDARGVLLDIGDGDYDKGKWDVLKDKLKALVCPPATTSQTVERSGIVDKGALGIDTYSFL
ncbi:altered inheritance of mitochondria 9 mitochondrial [Fusarium beomiforme]|uniref:Altered inheritance of mitochondria 9 mitochondrial n=1 Tax=Fusarium beomiforme TaxID=44412 RepID=A0A9P5AHF2_9HYPO|nr:altered inheritance of mitochondria 9 mitochondrial [Fusarium beomiforme]